MDVDGEVLARSQRVATLRGPVYMWRVEFCNWWCVDVVDGWINFDFGLHACGTMDPGDK